jgi:hypothetical protein
MGSRATKWPGCSLFERKIRMDHIEQSFAAKNEHRYTVTENQLLRILFPEGNPHPGYAYDFSLYHDDGEGTTLEIEFRRHIPNCQCHKKYNTDGTEK